MMYIETTASYNLPSMASINKQAIHPAAAPIVVFTAARAETLPLTPLVIIKIEPTTQKMSEMCRC
jgi:hypothetical protein